MTVLGLPAKPWTHGQQTADGTRWFDSTVGTEGAWRAQTVNSSLPPRVSALETAAPRTVANQAARDALYPTPVQGNSVFRTDLGAVETYFGLYSVSNPGGRDTAGWYTTNRASGLVPVKATTYTAVNGTGSMTALGSYNFTTCTGISLDGVFTSQFRNYRIVFSTTVGDSNDAEMRLQFRAGGANLTAVNHQYVANYANRTNSTSFVSFDNGSMQHVWLGNIYGNNNFVADVYNPQVSSTLTTMTYQAQTDVSALMRNIAGIGKYPANISVDGFRIYASLGNLSTGQITVYGYNN